MYYLLQSWFIIKSPKYLPFSKWSTCVNLYSVYKFVLIIMHNCISKYTFIILQIIITFTLIFFLLTYLMRELYLPINTFLPCFVSLFRNGQLYVYSCTCLEVSASYKKHKIYLKTLLSIKIYFFTNLEI